MIPDEQLAARAQAGDKLAADVLMRRYEKFAYAVGRDAAFRTHLTDVEDMAQEALHGLYGAVRYYRPGLGTTFRTFAATCIKRWLYTVVKHDLAMGRRADTPPLSLDAPTQAEYDEVPLIEAVADPRPRRRDLELELGGLFEFIAAELTQVERECLVRIARGDSYPEVVQALRELPRARGASAPWSEKTVDNAVQRARLKCRAYIAERDAA